MPTTDIGSTLADIPFRSAERFADRKALTWKQDGEWVSMSYAELATAAAEIARGLIDLGIEPGSRVGILAETRPEWTLAAYGVFAAGCSVVPIYATNSAHDCDWVLRDSGAVAVICENSDQLAKIAQLEGDLPGLQHVLSMEPVDGREDLDALRTRGRDLDDAERAKRTEAVSPEDLAILIYTSGTTGRPKGCMLSHGNLMSCAQQSVDLGIVGPDDSVYLFLPLAHIYAQTQNFAANAVGGEIFYTSGGAATIMSDLAEVSPTILPSVPRIYEKVYSAFSGAPRTPEVFEKVRGVFGGRVTFAITGAAPIAPEIIDFFQAAGVPIYEGYGLSETGAYGAVNLPGQVKAGTVGPPLPFGQIRVAEDGEIEMAGPHIFGGYWNNEQATADTFTEDGWFKTGDLGEFDADGFVKITGRKKEIIITAGGKNITPSELENELRQSPFISQAMMHGDRRPYPVALITLDQEFVVPWAKQQGIPDDADLTTRPEILREVDAVVTDVNSRHARVAQVKKFAILPDDFTTETGELTPTLKMRRKIIDDKYADVLDGLYS